MNDKMFVNQFNKLKEIIQSNSSKLNSWQYQELNQIKGIVRMIVNKASDLERLIEQKQFDEENEY